MKQTTNTNKRNTKPMENDSSFNPERTREDYQPYLRDAVKAFLKGTKCRTPDEAIRKNKRTMEEWLDIVEKYRQYSGYRNSRAA